jgi:hypothetical protein
MVKNRSFSTFSSFKLLRKLVIIWPAVEKSLSLSAEVAGAEKYLRANFANKGHFVA